jgi:glucans biosynthesis protein C
MSATLTPSSTSERLHALDNLRALMMWLGIVLHVSANHLTGPMVLPWRDQATSELADVLMAVIHVFRMPVFLMLAGYFVALLVARRGARDMLRHRMRRLALPFVVFWPILFIALGALAMIYAHRVERGYLGISLDVVPSMPGHPKINTWHLWFLYQLTGLVLLTMVALWLAPRLPQRLRDGISGAFKLLGLRAWGFAVLALPLAWIGAQYPQGLLVVNGSFAPPVFEWLHHGLFYTFGYFLYLHRESLLTHYTSYAARYAWAGALVCFASLGLLKELQINPASSEAFRLFASWSYNATTWLWSFALIGVALRHLNHQNPTLRYLADSAYWVYLVHMLGTIGFGALLYGAPLPAELKMLLNIAATTLMTLLSYHLLVRKTFIGHLLSGKRVV